MSSGAGLARRPPNAAWFAAGGVLIVLAFVGTIYAVTMFVAPATCGGVGFPPSSGAPHDPPPPDFALSSFVAGGTPGNLTDSANVSFVAMVLHWGEVGIVVTLTGAHGTPGAPPSDWRVFVLPASPTDASPAATFVPGLQNWTEGAGTAIRVGQTVTLDTRSVNLTGTGATVEFHVGLGCGSFSESQPLP
jgi:hypothetical protein